MSEIIDSLRWLERESEKIDFGSCAIQIFRHNGKTVRVEKSVTIKEQKQEASE